MPHAEAHTVSCLAADPFEAIRHYVDQRLRDAEARHAERFEFAQRQLEKADLTNAQRIDALGPVPGREEVMALFGSLQDRIVGEVKPLGERVERLAKTNWPMLAGAAGLTLSLISGGWMIVGLKIEAASQPMLVALETGKTERVQMGARIDRISTAVIRHEEERAALDKEQQTRLVELTQQTRALGELMNVGAEHRDQLLTILYRRVFPGDTLPALTYRPPLPGR